MWFVLVVAGRSTTVAVIAFTLCGCCLWSWRLARISLICSVCCIANILWLFHQKRAAYMNKGVGGGVFISPQRSKHSFLCGGRRFLLNTGWISKREWPCLKLYFFGGGRRHCCREFGISQVQYHPSYLRRGRHLHSLYLQNPDPLKSCIIPGRGAFLYGAADELIGRVIMTSIEVFFHASVCSWTCF